MSKFRFVMLETDDADAETIAAMVSVVRELQMARPAAPAPSSPTFAVAAAGSPPPALPKAKPAPVEAPQAGGLERGPSGRVNGVGDLILEAMKTGGGTVDKAALARKAYGDDDSETIKRISRAIWSLVERGRLKKLNDGTYKVVG